VPSATSIYSTHTTHAATTATAATATALPHTHNQQVVGIAGDMTAPNGLDISPSDRQLLQAEVDTVIHCAADIRLEMGIQELLRANFEGTRQLLELAGD
jgi:thioester reductase-like protein